MYPLKIIFITCFSLIVLIMAENVLAQRIISINGVLLNQQQAAELDQVVGEYVQNGHYWINYNTGTWGYMGNPQPQGYLGGNPIQGGSPADSYSGDNYRGPFGDYMSDGTCSFVNGVPVGNCD